MRMLMFTEPVGEQECCGITLRGSLISWIRPRNAGQEEIGRAPQIFDVIACSTRLTTCRIAIHSCPRGPVRLQTQAGPLPGGMSCRDGGPKRVETSRSIAMDHPGLSIPTFSRSAPPIFPQIGMFLRCASFASTRHPGTRSDNEAQPPGPIGIRLERCFRRLSGKTTGCRLSLN